MLPPDRGLLAALCQTLPRKLADGLQHAEPWLALRLLLHPLPQQVLIHQRLDPIEDIHLQRLEGTRGRVTDRLGRFQCAAPHKDRQPPEQRLLSRLQQVVAPGDGAPQRLMPLLQVPRPPVEQLQPVLQPRQHRFGRQ